MGLLDDAIREHLELKRRRGADPAEMERLEREALGPVRRGTDEPDQTPLQGGEPEAAAYADEGGSDWSDAAAVTDTAVDHVPEEEPFSSAEPGLFDHEATRGRPAPSDVPPEPTFSQRPSPAPAPSPELEPVSPVDHLDHETAEYDVEAEHARESEEPEDHPGHEQGRTGDEHAEDVLEETPEFLQDTPDHDRLWFEQRPPRDFHFDE